MATRIAVPAGPGIRVAYGVRPPRYAAASRVGTPVLASRFATCVSTVRGERNSRSATWALVRPSATSPSTSASRAVTRGRAAGAGTGVPPRLRRGRCPGAAEQVAAGAGEQDVAQPARGRRGRHAGVGTGSPQPSVTAASQHDGAQQPAPPRQAGERRLAVGEQRGGLVVAARATVPRRRRPRRRRPGWPGPGRRASVRSIELVRPHDHGMRPGLPHPCRASAASAPTPCSIVAHADVQLVGARGRSCSSRATTTRTTCRGGDRCHPPARRRRPACAPPTVSRYRRRTRAHGVDHREHRAGAEGALGQPQGAGQLDGSAGHRLVPRPARRPTRCSRRGRSRWRRPARACRRRGPAPAPAGADAVSWARSVRHHPELEQRRRRATAPGRARPRPGRPGGRGPR